MIQSSRSHFLISFKVDEPKRLPFFLPQIAIDRQ